MAPRRVYVWPRFALALAGIDHGVPQVVHLGDDLEHLREDASPLPDRPDLDPELGLVILYTSGTTGLPKGVRSASTGPAR